MVVRGTTPGFVLEIEGYDLSGCSVIVTIERSTQEINLTGNRLSISYSDETSSIAFRLTQEETLKLTKGVADIQVKFIDSNGIALATEKAQFEVCPALYEEVITYGSNANNTP